MISRFVCVITNHVRICAEKFWKGDPIPSLSQHQPEGHRDGADMWRFKKLLLHG